MPLSSQADAHSKTTQQHGAKPVVLPTSLAGSSAVGSSFAKSAENARQKMITAVSSKRDVIPHGGAAGDLDLTYITSRVVVCSMFTGVLEGMISMQVCKKTRPMALFTFAFGFFFWICFGFSRLVFAVACNPSCSSIFFIRLFSGAHLFLLHACGPAAALPR